MAKRSGRSSDLSDPLSEAKHYFEGGEGAMNKYACQVCGYIYDPVKGDPENGINAGTRFEDLSDDWVCPVCGASKEMFEKVNE